MERILRKMVNRYYNLPCKLVLGTETYHFDSGWKSSLDLGFLRKAVFGWILVSGRFKKWGFFIYRSKK